MIELIDHFCIFMHNCACGVNFRHATDIQGFIDDGSVHLQGGNLTEAIQHNPKAMQWYQNGRKIARSIAQGLAHLHSHEMVSFGAA